jgi:hypothetical protein
MPWDIPTKQYIRNNGRNTGSTVWDKDAVAAQVIDSGGHDTHDQDIAEGITQTLNINGINAMLADLDVGTFKLTNVADGVAAGDGVNYGQLTSVEAKADTNTTDISGLDTRVTALEGAGTPDPLVAINFKSNGPIRHKLSSSTGASSLDVSSQGRFFHNNNGAHTLTFTNLPSLDDPDLGAIYRTEVSVTVWNGATPGTITLSGLGTPRVVGEQSTDANVAQVLTVFIDRVSGTNNVTVIWSS